MPISPPVPHDTRSQLADWLEVECLAAPEGVAAARVRRLWSALDESGHETEPDPETLELVETEILEEKSASCEAEVAEELEWRRRVLRDLYPFELESSPANWRLTRAPQAQGASERAGRSCYLFCLLVSALRDLRIAPHGCGDLTRDAELSFEWVAANASAALVGGDVIRFGWPREDGTSFRKALGSVGTRLGWEPRNDDPLWSQGREKDAGVDLIAWRDFADRRPGRLLLFGQAASGRRWAEKEVDPTRSFFHWFRATPARHYIPALFTPFPQHHKCNGRKGDAFEDVAKAEAWKREQSCGLVLDRLRIVEMAANRLASHAERDELQTLRTVEEWVTRAREAASS